MSIHHWLVASTVGLLLVVQRVRSQVVSCDNAPNCTALHREPCDRRNGVPDVCGECEVGYIGVKGPTNVACAANQSCALVYPGQIGCPDESVPSTPFVVPYGACVCDTGGRHWPTAPNWCSALRINLIGLFELQLCQACDGPDGVGCAPLATWSPAKRPFACSTRGSDSYAFSDGCPETWDPSALCGHPALVVEPGRKNEGCLLAPRCPESVLSSNLAETCCFGTPLSHPLTEWGHNEDEPAPGFCRGPPPHEPGLCGVITAAPGWIGCHCMGPIKSDRKVCTLQCDPPNCPLPKDGLRPTPEHWLTSEIPSQLRPPDRSRTEWLQQQDTSSSRPGSAIRPGLLFLVASVTTAGAGGVESLWR